jgi:hypothetical protein
MTYQDAYQGTTKWIAHLETLHNVTEIRGIANEAVWNAKPEIVATEAEQGSKDAWLDWQRANGGTREDRKRRAYWASKKRK